MSFEWSEGRKLWSLRTADAWYSYSYSADGIRDEKHVMNANGSIASTTHFYLDGSRIAAQQTDSESPIYFYYDGEGKLTGFEYLGNVYYYLRNGQNDITGIIDSSGNQVVSYVYDSWGKLLNISGSMADTIGVENPFRYRGYYYDTETGLYYLQSRYYDPVVGRFLNADALVGATSDMSTYNLFVYCANNPVNNFDPSGFGWISNAWNWTKNKATQAKNWVVSTWNNFTGNNGGSTTPPINVVDKAAGVSDLGAGTTAYGLSKQRQSVTMTKDSNNVVHPEPSGSIRTMAKYPKATRAVNKASTVISVGITALNVVDTWTANNSNTTGQRWGKMGVQIGTMFAGIGIGYVAALAANCWNPVGWGMFGAAATYIGVSFLLGSALDMATTGIYNSAGIE